MIFVFINSRCAFAARVTVVSRCVCVCLLINISPLECVRPENNVKTHSHSLCRYAVGLHFSAFHISICSNAKFLSFREKVLTLMNHSAV